MCGAVSCVVWSFLSAGGSGGVCLVWSFLVVLAFILCIYVFLDCSGFHFQGDHGFDPTWYQGSPSTLAACP